MNSRRNFLVPSHRFSSNFQPNIPFCPIFIRFLIQFFRWIPGVTFYLAADALFLGLMAAALCLSFFPGGLTRIALLTVLFPCLSLSLCAWMTVFGFYLRLEDMAKRAEKRKMASKKVLNHTQKTFVNLAFDDVE